MFDAIDEEHRQILLDYAEFLSGKYPQSIRSFGEPVLIPRAEGESVVGAIKRLSKSYPMLDKKHMLHEVSGLMAEHVIKGRSAAEVIDELEIIFEQHYRKAVEEKVE